jgi:hypothetical protein
MRDKKDRERRNEGQRGGGRKVRYTEEGLMRDKKDGGTRMRNRKYCIEGGEIRTGWMEGEGWRDKKDRER